MKLKTILCAGLAALVLASGSLAFAAAEAPEPVPKGDQVRLIVSSLATWKPTRKGDYVLTDLDGNGRYEIITARVTNKQATEIHIWEANAAGTFILPVSLPWADGDSQPDIRASSSAAVWYDAANDVRWYIFEDVRLADDAEITDIVALSLKNGAVTSEVLATHSGGAYTDAAGAPIDAAAYENAAAERFAGLERQTASFVWISTDEHPLDNAPMEQIARTAADASIDWGELALDTGVDMFVRLYMAATVRSDPMFRLPDNLGDVLYPANFGMRYGEPADIDVNTLVMEPKLVTTETASGEMTSVKSGSAEPGETITLYMIAENHGGDGSTIVEAYDGDTLLASKFVSVEGGSFAVVKLDVTLTGAGLHTITVGDNSLNVTVA